MFDNFLIRAALAGVGVAVTAAPLGCFVLWRRMAFFSDATAHAAILGVAMALALQWPVFWGALAIALAVALAVTNLGQRGHAADTLLAVMAHSSLAVGLVAVSFVRGVRIDITAFLFGDILAVDQTDLAVIGIGAIGVLLVLAWRWSALLTATLNEDLARAAGVSPRIEQLVLTLTLAVVVAVSIKVVGALLIGAMLVVPPAVARPFSRTPETMALAAAGVGAASALGGLLASWQFDTPTGPTIVCVATILFILSSAVSGVRQAD